jgi:hypothetical protein
MTNKRFSLPAPRDTAWHHITIDLENCRETVYIDEIAILFGYGLSIENIGNDLDSPFIVELFFDENNKQEAENE